MIIPSTPSFLGMQESYQKGLAIENKSGVEKKQKKPSLSSHDFSPSRVQNPRRAVMAIKKY